MESFSFKGDEVVAELVSREKLIYNVPASLWPQSLEWAKQCGFEVTTTEVEHGFKSGVGDVVTEIVVKISIPKDLALQHHSDSALGMAVGACAGIVEDFDSLIETSEVPDEETDGGQ